jgi:ATP-dependent RNA helicase DDX31/DBP7
VAEAPVQSEAAAPAKPSNAPSDGTFASLPLRPELIDALCGPKMGLERPTPIQASALPVLLDPKADSDAILQAQTGSGKTLAYLLPIVQDLVALAASRAAKGRPLDRSVGTLAIILVPTRELANQIYETAQALLSYRAPKSEDVAEGASPRWLTPGLLSGGMSRQHEKARLRKGIPLLIATVCRVSPVHATRLLTPVQPGRLLDHLSATASFRLAGEPARKKKKPAPTGDDDFDVEDHPFVRDPNAASDSDDSDVDLLAKPTSRSYRPRFADAPDADLSLRWLVLDEADRLMDMGFEPQIKQVLDHLARRSRLNSRRRTVLCSATMQESVEKLAGMALRKPKTISAATPSDVKGGETVRYAPPAQLVQSYAIVPPKLRFVALVALLRRLLAPSIVVKKGEGNKALVFVSCTAAVDLLWAAIGGLQMGRAAEDEGGKGKATAGDGLAQRSAILPGAAVYRLHGNLDLPTRLASLKAFAHAEGSAALICTSVAARGLDVPFVRSVVQYDLPTEVRLASGAR